MPGNFPLLESIRTVIIMPVVGFMFAIALVAFVWGMMEFVKGGANEKKVEEAKNKMLYGLGGMALMASAVGMVNLICATLQC
ncbi:MAG: hypothetical protein A2542_02100 [Parcubacteria group bacterium RIFOXYD2_FULL_52_8]|nr:MAG: hypothetical protein A2542_02100 [Parcubacteria group bacterium RIFOXYD2_FULL_52_8]